MRIHSTILVHWTGKKDIELEPEDVRRKRYLERLLDYYQNGLFAKRVTEETLRKRKIKNFVRICFTEIRLSQAKLHADRYGKLGIGFARDFILDKGGRPVIYVPYRSMPGSRLLEESIEKMSNKWLEAHVKRMSNGKSEDSNDYEDYYEEMEWRLVYDESSDNKHFTDGHERGVHRLRFKSKDVRVIIFPDESMKRMSLEDEKLKKYLSEHMPIMAALDACGDF